MLTSSGSVQATSTSSVQVSEWDIAVGSNLSACHRCEQMQKGCRGACACSRDGRDIIEHAQEGYCPLGKHAAPPSRGLGDTIAKVAHAIGADKAAHVFERVTGRGCGCEKRREKLNALMPYRDTGVPPVRATSDEKQS